MYWDKLLESLMVAVTGGINTALTDMYYDKRSLDHYLIPAICAAVIFFILSLLVGVVRRLNKKKFEGWWMEIVEKGGDLYLSRYCIRYNFFSGKHTLAGTSCTEKGEFHSSWTSRWMDFDIENNKVSYLYTGTLLRQNDVPGYAVLNFQPSEPNSKLTHGIGFLVDMGATPIRCDFKFYRYDEELIKYFTGDDNLGTPEKIVDFIAKYVAEYPNRVHRSMQGKETMQGQMIVKNENPVRLFSSLVNNPPLKMYYEVNHLKQLYRQGWLKRNLPAPNCETVAEHTFGMTVLAMVLKDPAVVTDADRVRAMKMALIHDFGEIYAGDFTPGQVPSQEKYNRELNSITEVFGKLDNGQEYIELWKEYEERTTPVAQFVADLDNMEMRLQACIYERQKFGPLSDFFDEKARYSSPYIQELFETIAKLRAGGGLGDRD